MRFESIANELILDLFEHLSTVDLLRAFGGLNARLTHLLDDHFQSHAVDLQSAPKKEFDLLTRDHLPRIAHRLVALRLSDDDETPQGVDRFFAAGLHLQQFSRLRSLHLSELHSSHRILTQIHTLSQLTHLHITQSSLDENLFYNADIIDAIQRLPNLIDCYLDMSHQSNWYTPITQIVAANLKSVALPHLDCSVNQLVSLIAPISNLQSLQVRISDDGDIGRPSTVTFPFITTLKIIYGGLFDAIKYLLERMPNLSRLQIDTTCCFVNGHQWQSLIECSLPKLVVLQLKMFSSLSEHASIDDLLLSFATPFWLEDHQWFVQCDWNGQEQYSLIHVYTLPYPFEYYLRPKNIQSKSTCPTSDRTRSYDRVQHIYSGCLLNLPFQSRKLYSLDVSFTDAQLLDSSVFTFQRLRSLSISLPEHLDHSFIHAKLEDFLHRSEYLYSLTIFSWSTKYLSLLDIEQHCIRRLDLRGPFSFFDEVQCLKLSRSFLGRRCEVLLLGVQQPSSILDLLHFLKHLRALTVRNNTNAELLQWLQPRLPRYYTVSDSSKDTSQVRLWIR